MESLTRKAKPFVLILFLFSLFDTVQAQKDPAWLANSWRTTQYPSNVYLTGYVQDEKNNNESTADAVGRVTAMARGNLTESIISSIKSVSDSYSQSISDGKSETIKETFQSEIQVSANLQINGVKVESYVKDNTVYGFAYANKYEIIGYYKSTLNMKVQQIQGYINTAKALEEKREKIKAKEEYNKTLPVFEDIKKAQGILSALDKNISQEELKMQKTMNLYNEVIQANARLTQAVLVYISTQEDLFGENISAIESGLKAVLAENECSFTTEEQNADWKLYVNASSREFNYSNKVYFSYVDAEVQLFKAPSDKHVYQDEFEQKGAHGKSYRAAARNAYKEISNLISDKILNWINH
ncbi:MAG TPA: hypothetical protein VJ896_12960 [Bacteroidales bacterium]|nr:hypothetical protein [Bacteroidales bacterium]